jgi:hypothetical protein
MDVQPTGFADYVVAEAQRRLSLNPETLYADLCDEVLVKR